jgi:hypothetical protein
LFDKLDKVADKYNNTSLKTQTQQLRDIQNNPQHLQQDVYSKSTVAASDALSLVLSDKQTPVVEESDYSNNKRSRIAMEDSHASENKRLTETVNAMFSYRASAPSHSSYQPNMVSASNDGYDYNPGNIKHRHENMYSEPYNNNYNSNNYNVNSDSAYYNHSGNRRDNRTRDERMYNTDDITNEQDVAASGAFCDRIASCPKQSAACKTPAYRVYKYLEKSIKDIDTLRPCDFFTNQPGGMLEHMSKNKRDPSDKRANTSD